MVYLAVVLVELLIRGVAWMIGAAFVLAIATAYVFGVLFWMVLAAVAALWQAKRGRPSASTGNEYVSLRR